MLNFLHLSHFSPIMSVAQYSLVVQNHGIKKLSFIPSYLGIIAEYSSLQQLAHFSPVSCRWMRLGDSRVASVRRRSPRAARYACTRPSTAVFTGSRVPGAGAASRTGTPSTRTWCPRTETRASGLRARSPAAESRSRAATRCSLTWRLCISVVLALVVSAVLVGVVLGVQVEQEEEEVYHKCHQLWTSTSKDREDCTQGQNTFIYLSIFYWEEKDWAFLGLYCREKSYYPRTSILNLPHQIYLTHPYQNILISDKCESTALFHEPWHRPPKILI